MTKAKQESQTIIEVTAPNMQCMSFLIRGTSPYCQNKFGGKAKQMMRDQQEAGSSGKSKKKREAKNFDSLYEDAMHRCGDWHGIPASAFRAAMISACRVAGVVMTRAKLAVFVEADGFDDESGDPLVKITSGEPHKVESMVRNASGVADIRPRPVWNPGWEAVVRIRYDADAISGQDVMNLLLRAGQQVGIGEGRADSPKSVGLGWGFFTIEESSEL